MKRSIRILAAVASIAAAPALLAAPVMAADLTFAKKDSSPVTEHAIGQPYWMLQAQCAGLFGSMSNFQSARGRTGDADQAKSLGVSFMHDSMARLERDRGLDEHAALAAAGQQVNVGRAHAQQIIALGVDDHSQWNVERSFCLDVNDAYHARNG